MPQISTPCVQICVLDETAGLCLGCGRTPEEIARWMLFSEEQRRAVMAELRSRLEKLAATLNDEDRACRA